MRLRCAGLPFLFAFPLAFLSACSAPSGNGESARVFSFEEPVLSAAWQPAETNGAGTPALWRVQADASAPDGKQVLRLAESWNVGDTYNLLLHSGPWPADLELSVRLRADGGREDRGGGLVWRAQGGGSYYLTRWNPLEHNLRIYKVVNGVRTSLQSAELAADAQAWHLLAVSVHGTHMQVRFDGAPLLEVRDEALRGPGLIGLWTKADATSSFDRLTALPAFPE